MEQAVPKNCTAQPAPAQRPSGQRNRTSAVQHRETTPMNRRMGPCGHSAAKPASLLLPLPSCWCRARLPPLLLPSSLPPAVGRGSAGTHSMHRSWTCCKQRLPGGEAKLRRHTDTLQRCTKCRPHLTHWGGTAAGRQSVSRSGRHAATPHCLQTGQQAPAARLSSNSHNVTQEDSVPYFAVFATRFPSPPASLNSTLGVPAVLGGQSSAAAARSTADCRRSPCSSAAGASASTPSAAGPALALWRCSPLYSSPSPITSSRVYAAAAARMPRRVPRSGAASAAAGPRQWIGRALLLLLLLLLLRGLLLPLLQ